MVKENFGRSSSNNNNKKKEKKQEDDACKAETKKNLVFRTSSRCSAWSRYLSIDQSCSIPTISIFTAFLSRYLEKRWQFFFHVESTAWNTSLRHESETTMTMIPTFKTQDKLIWVKDQCLTLCSLVFVSRNHSISLLKYKPIYDGWLISQFPLTLGTMNYISDMPSDCNQIRYCAIFGMVHGRKDMPKHALAA